MSRKSKALRRRQGVIDIDLRWAIRNGRLPLYAESVSVCSCGRTAWLMPGADDEEHAQFWDDESDHEACCGADFD